MTTKSGSERSRQNEQNAYYKDHPTESHFRVEIQKLKKGYTKNII